MFKYASLDVENHYTPETYALSFAHRIGLEDEIVVSEFLYGPIQRTSVFVVDLKPDIRAKVCKSDRDREKDDSDPSRIKVVSLAY